MRRGCAHRTPGPRAAARAGSRRRPACRSRGPTKVRIGCRSSGGVASVDISRMPVTAISSVRGMGVALIARMSTLVLSFLRASLCSTPKRCSSSMMTRPRSLNVTVEPRMRWVPMTMSTLPSARPSMASLASLSVWKRLSGRRCTGKSGEPLGECLHVLLHEQRGRHDHGDLLAILNRLERGANGDLGLAVADVAREQAVHGDGRLHVALDLVDRGQLVGRLDERERLLELLLPRGVGRERVTRDCHARRVQLDELDRDVANGATSLALRCGPVAAAHLAEGWRLAADIAGEQVELVGRNVELVARVAALVGRVLDDQEFARRLHRVASAARHLALGELDELADAVRLVHDEVAGLELQRVDDILALGGEPLDLAGVVAGGASVELGLAEHGELDLGNLETRLDVGLHEVGDAGFHPSPRLSTGKRLHDAPRDLVLAEHIAPRARPGRCRGRRWRRSSRRGSARARARWRR